VNDHDAASVAARKLGMIAAKQFSRMDCDRRQAQLLRALERQVCCASDARGLRKEPHNDQRTRQGGLGSTHLASGGPDGEFSRGGVDPAGQYRKQ
jgi:hypothetical protein